MGRQSGISTVRRLAGGAGDIDELQSVCPWVAAGPGQDG